MSKIKKLEDLLALKKINRREFMARISALGLTATLSPAILSMPASAGVPKKGGRLRVGLTEASTSDSFDAGGACCSVWEMWLTFQFRNNITEIDPKGRPIPALAESWESTPDASKWIFKIRNGVEFHNGKTLDSNDIIYSLNHHRKEESKSPAKSMLAPIKEIKADGKHAVIIETEGGYADMPALMSDYHLQIVPDGHTAWQECMGTGPFIKKDFEPGIRFLSVRNPNYWKDGLPHFDEVESIGMHDRATRTTALQSGEIDVMNDPDLKTVHLLKRLPGVQVIRTPSSRHFTIPMITGIEPYNNNDVRLALKYAIDREELFKKILQGYGSLGNDHPIGPIMQYFNSDLPQRKYDPDKAKFHLKKAGLEAHEFKLHTAEFAHSGAVDAALLIQQSAAKAGVNIKVVREPNDGYWSNVWRKKPWSMCSWSPRATEDMMFSVAYAEDAVWNDTHWKDERFNQLLRDARKELNESKRRDMYWEMQKITRDKGATVVHLFTDHVIAATSKLKFKEPMAGNFEMDGQRGFEKWWFSS